MVLKFIVDIRTQVALSRGSKFCFAIQEFFFKQPHDVFDSSVRENNERVQLVISTTISSLLYCDFTERVSFA